jgi:hypothetical protein
MNAVRARATYKNSKWNTYIPMYEMFPDPPPPPKIINVKQARAALRARENRRTVRMLPHAYYGNHPVHWNSLKKMDNVGANPLGKRILPAYKDTRGWRSLFRRVSRK